MKTADEKTFFFIEGIPPGAKTGGHPEWTSEESNIINAFHRYDGFSLFTKKFQSWFTITTEEAKLIIGKKNVQSYFNSCLKKPLDWAKKHMGNIPSLLGEFGLAFDMNNRKAFSGGNYSLHEDALSMYYDAVDANLLHSTIWNYTAENTNKTGDGWNEEDLSIFSEGKERAAAGWKRPYPMATAGDPLLINWNRKKGIFDYCFKADKTITAPTIIYLPTENFTAASKINSPLRFEFKPEKQRLLIYNDSFDGEVKIQVTASTFC